MNFVDLNDKQVGYIEDKLSSFDENYITYKMDGNIRIGIEEDGQIIAGLDACVTAFKILYVSTVFVDERYRRKGYGKQLVEEMEKRAKEMGEVKKQLVSDYLNAQIGKPLNVLFETCDKDGIWCGHTENYVKVYSKNGDKNTIKTIVPTGLYLDGLCE